MPLLILCLTFVTTGGTVQQQELPDGEGKEVFMTKCSVMPSITLPGLEEPGPAGTAS